MTPPPSGALALMLWAALAAAATGCTEAATPNGGRREAGRERSRAGPEAGRPKGYGPPVVVGKIHDRRLTESSGLAASRAHKGVYWTHNDSGGGPVLHCVDDEARSCGLWRVSGAEAVDWEDIAAAEDARGRPHLYIGDIGDNGLKRRSVTVYRVPEPLSLNGSGSGPMRTTAPATPIELVYPDGTHNAETLMVREGSEHLYVVTKEFTRPAVVYRATPPFRGTSPHELTRVARLRLVGGGAPFTGGDIAPDGRRVAFILGPLAFELRLPPGQRRFDAIWDAPLLPVKLGGSLGGEAIAYDSSGRALFTTSEGKRPPLLAIRRR
jgi:hypothetical protein